jgi:hypothetical protein
MNKLFFAIETEAPYTEQEIQDLTEAFTTFALEVDPDVDPETAEVSISDAKDKSGGITDEQKREIIEDFLKNSSTVLSVQIAQDGEIYKTLSLED